MQDNSNRRYRVIENWHQTSPWVPAHGRSQKHVAAAFTRGSEKRIVAIPEAITKDQAAVDWEVARQLRAADRQATRREMRIKRER